MYFNHDSYSLYYEKYGKQDKTILILPGWGDTRKSFINIINHFKDDYSIYIVDWLGFGNSVFPEHDLTIYEYTNIIINFMEENNIINPVVIAHSFGGRIAILLNGYYKERIEKIVLMDSAGIKPRHGFKYFFKTYSYKLLKKLKCFIPKRKRALYLKKLFKLFSSSDYINLPNNMYNSFKNIINEELKYYLKDMTSDVLLLWGSNDLDTPLKNGKLMNKLINKSSLIVIEGGSHFVYLNYPILINNIIDEFIK